LLICQAEVGIRERFHIFRYLRKARKHFADAMREDAPLPKYGAIAKDGNITDAIFCVFFIEKLQEKNCA
jgi:hypothetical protein